MLNLFFNTFSLFSPASDFKLERIFLEKKKEVKKKEKSISDYIPSKSADALLIQSLERENSFNLKEWG